MSDILTIDTSKNLYANNQLDPLPLYDERHPMMSQSIPEYDTRDLPNRHIESLIARLKITMKLYGGLGLSANQCGVFERLFILGHEDFILSCINPKVVEESKEMVREREGCLSFPGMFLTVERPSWIVAEFVTESGETQRMRLDGITARCYLHELDHMNGVTFTQRVGPTALMLAKKKQSKIMKQIVRKQKSK